MSVFANRFGRRLLPHAVRSGQQQQRLAGCRSLATTNVVDSSGKIEELTVIGGGLMGCGIAQVAAQTGHKVTLVDISDEVVGKARGKIETSLQRMAKRTFRSDTDKAGKFVSDAMANLSTDTSADNSLTSTDIVIEAVVENMKLKHEIFADLDAKAPSNVIFASNTSSLPITEIGQVLSESRRLKFGGLHFFNPVPMMKLVEVVRISSTDDATFDALNQLVAAMDKTAVACKDTPGFIVNRLLVPSLLEAVRLAERGDASVEDIDVAMELGAGHPMGPFRLADYVGLDTIKFIVDGWHEAYPDVQLFNPSPLIDKLVGEGKLGVKSGHGFYDYAKQGK